MGRETKLLLLSRASLLSIEFVRRGIYIAPFRRNSSQPICVQLYCYSTNRMLHMIHMHNDANFLLIYIYIYAHIMAVSVDCTCADGNEWRVRVHCAEVCCALNAHCLFCFSLVLFFYRFAFCHAHAEAFSTLPNLVLVHTQQHRLLHFCSSAHSISQPKTLQHKYAYTVCVVVIVFFYCWFHTSGATLLPNEIWFWNFHLFTFLFVLSLLFQEIVSLSFTSMCILGFVSLLFFFLGCCYWSLCSCALEKAT